MSESDSDAEATEPSLAFDRERKLALVFAALGVAVGLAVEFYTSQPDWVPMAIVVVAGLVLPQLVDRALP